MIKRKLYYSRKNRKIVIEGVQTKYGKKHTIYIWTLPDPLTLLTRLDPLYEGYPSYKKKSWFFTKEKYKKLMEKINRVDYQE